MEEFPELLAYVPKVEGERMDFYSYKLGDEVQINRWGIEEPVGGEKSTPVTGCIVLVPVLVSTPLVPGSAMVVGTTINISVSYLMTLIAPIYLPVYG